MFIFVNQREFCAYVNGWWLRLDIHWFSPISPKHLIYRLLFRIDQEIKNIYLNFSYSYYAKAAPRLDPIFINDRHERRWSKWEKLIESVEAAASATDKLFEIRDGTRTHASTTDKEL